MANMIAFDDKHDEIIFPIENTQLRSGDLILIKSGEQVPADCKILWGSATVNESIITGESLPITKQKKDILIGGSLLTDGTVKAQVNKAAGDSVLANIINLVKQAQGEKPPVQQMADKISAIFQNYFESIAPKSVKVIVKPHHGGEPYFLSSENIGYKAASMAMQDTYGKKPVPTRGGGSIPIVALFKKELGLDSILFGFGLDSDALHSPNEHYGLFNYYKGIETIPLFYKYFDQLSSK
jgi:hypothetical protein